MSVSLPSARVAHFYAFMTERENIRLRRLLGWPREEWTLDPIFRTYSFTNVKREHDRTSTLLMKEFYAPNVLDTDSTSDDAMDLENEDDLRCILMNCAVARFFGTVEAALVIGWIDDWGPRVRDRILTYGAQDDLKFTSAYIIPACGQSRPKYEIVCDILDGIYGSVRGEKADSIVTAMCTVGWERAADIMTSLWGVGPFMAKEVLLDYIMTTRQRPRDWQTWTPVGPGGRRGACRILHGHSGHMDESSLDVIREVYEQRAQHWRPDFVELDLTDIQWVCCEYDKYCRVAEGRRPKRRFRPTVDDVTRSPT